MAKIVVQQTPVTVITDAGNDYICLTDMAGAKNNESRAADIIKNIIPILKWSNLTTLENKPDYRAL